ncbi:CDGSH iron-sulfur domain-containing protein [Defluviimonas sp. D31]|jgi:CDGSH-type Zn-finger protein|uniref:CDGSH iron-sulfur domain-containing protein n=1 Tax=Defluviimonas sp. D31 TaxID=3083253 RepID=UPI00296E336E|nr:CDGSH iron-sulfur domain-containing protein [Defluviimonas sp. D31]MDW4549205.1 CDGSH iron-sulfur domain-containing protein [Defluviimonas sp. D31]
MTDDTKVTIEARENGPFVVKRLTRLKGEDGAMLETKPVTTLCRCGHSAKKPFCDGSHKRVGFESDAEIPAAGRDRLIAYEGEEVTVTYNPRLCSHAAECGRIAGNVFNPAEKPWVQPDKGSRNEIESVIAACPSGALALAGPEHLMPSGRAEIEVQKNGPYWVLGPELVGASPSGEGASREKYVLCRCGLSGNKPFCDGSHRDKGWKSGT